MAPGATEIEFITLSEGGALFVPELQRLQTLYPGAIDENHQVITLILKKYVNLPLYLENYALFLLPPIFANILYTYPLMYIIHLGEPSGNIVSTMAQ